jgi:hypothetical protein
MTSKDEMIAALREVAVFLIDLDENECSEEGVNYPENDFTPREIRGIVEDMAGTYLENDEIRIEWNKKSSAEIRKLLIEAFPD